MQTHQEPQQLPTTSSPLASTVNDGVVTSATTQEAAMELDDNAMDLSVDDVSDALQDMGTTTELAAEVIQLDDEVEDEEVEEEAQAIEDIDMDGDDSDSDYDFDQDLANFDEEDDNDEVDEDERFHYFQSLIEEIEATAEVKSDLYVMNMLAQRNRIMGEEAAWVDQFLKEQEEWKQKNGKSVDDYSLLERLAGFIPDKLERKRPVRATRK
ncbi:hypothetical protein Gpo141_00010158 [Globisporangium polare]